MTPHFCRVRHEPPHTYGDCIRACVASILDMDPEDVPHFYHDNADGETGMIRLREWLAGLSYGAIYFAFEGSVPRDDIFKIWGEMNPDVPVILLASTASETDHAVILQGSKVVHDPAWYRSSIVGPHSNGYWNVIVIAVK